MCRTPSSIVFCSSIAVASVLTACVAGIRHGDARLVDAKGFPLEAADWLEFPKMPLGASGVFRYRVEALPQVIYPSGFLLDVPENEALGPRREFPWSSCVVRASLLTPDGRTFHSRTIRLGRDRLGSEPGKRGRRRVFFRFTDYNTSGTTRLPSYLTYDLQIEVLRPSARPFDALTAVAFTVLHTAARPRPREGNANHLKNPRGPLPWPLIFGPLPGANLCRSIAVSKAPAPSQPSATS